MGRWLAVSLFRDLSTLPEKFAASWGTLHFPSFCNHVSQSETGFWLHGMVLVLQLMLKELDKFMIAQSQFLGMTLCQCNLQMLHFPQQGSIDDQLSVNSSFGMMHAVLGRVEEENPSLDMSEQPFIVLLMYRHLILSVSGTASSSSSKYF